MTDRHATAPGVQLWPPNGRMGRLRFFYLSAAAWILVSLVSIAVGWLAGLPDSSLDVHQYASTAVLMALLAPLLILRSHDIGFSGWWALLAVIPFVGLLWLIPRGTPGPNRFGAPPPANTRADKVWAGIVGGLLLTIVLLVIVAFAVLFLMFGGMRF